MVSGQHSYIYNINEMGSPFVSICGYNNNEFIWKETSCDSSAIYQTTGIIIAWEGKKYIVTIREYLVSCNYIVMYRYAEDGTVVKNNLQICFQSLEYNILILGTEEPLDLSIDLKSTKLIAPTKRSGYQATLVKMRESYYIDTYDVKFVKSTIYNKSYLPDKYMYKFMITGCKDLFGSCGAPILNKKRVLIGMILKSDDGKLLVLPTKAIQRVVDDFVSFIHRPLSYESLLKLPITLQTKKSKVRLLEQKASLISVDHNDISVVDDIIMIYDKDYNQQIPLDIYLNLSLKQDNAIILVIEKKKVQTELSLFPVPYSFPYFPLSKQARFDPCQTIPYINLRGIIIVEMTHEVRDIMMRNKKTIKNHIMENLGEETSPHLLIIDCLDTNLRKKYKLPNLIPGKKQILKCPVILTVNERIATTLSDVNIPAQYIICYVDQGVPIEINI